MVLMPAKIRLSSVSGYIFHHVLRLRLQGRLYRKILKSQPSVKLTPLVQA